MITSMKMYLILVVLLTASVTAQEGENSYSSPEDVFNDIMNSLSVESQEEVKTAGNDADLNDRLPESEGVEYRENPTEISDVHELPEEMRIQVEQAMKKIQEEREKRVLELKEINRKKK